MDSKISFCDEFLNINNHPKAARYQNIAYVGMLAPAALGMMKGAPYLKGSFVQYLPIPSNILSGLGVGVLHMTICEELYDTWIDSFFNNWGSWQDKSYANRTMRTAIKLSAVALTLTFMSHCFSYWGTFKVGSYTIANFSTIPFEKAFGYVVINKAIQAFFITVRGPQGCGDEKSKYHKGFEVIRRSAKFIRSLFDLLKTTSNEIKEEMRVISAQAQLNGNNQLELRLLPLGTRYARIMIGGEALFQNADRIVPKINAILNPATQGLHSLRSLELTVQEVGAFIKEHGTRAKEVLAQLLEVQKEIKALDPSPTDPADDTSSES